MINSDDIQAPYNYEKRAYYVPVPKEVRAQGHEFTLTFPAHSFTQIEVRIK